MVQQKTKYYVKNKETSLIVDETSVNFKKYAQISVGNIEFPNLVYAANLIHLKSPINNQILTNMVKNI